MQTVVVQRFKHKLKPDYYYFLKNDFKKGNQNKGTRRSVSVYRCSLGFLDVILTQSLSDIIQTGMNVKT